MCYFHNYVIWWSKAIYKLYVHLLNFQSIMIKKKKDYYQRLKSHKDQIKNHHVHRQTCDILFKSVFLFNILVVDSWHCNYEEMVKLIPCSNVQKQATYVTKG